MTQNISNLPVYNKNQYSQTPAGPNFTAGNNPVSSSGLMQNNPLVSHAGKAQSNNNTFIAGIGLSALGLFTLNNFINNPLQTKDYDDTFFKKVETFVDKQAAKYSTKPAVQKTTGFFQKLNKGIKTRIDNSEILRTLFRKPSMGGPQVQSQAAGARGHLANRAIEVLRKYNENNSFKDFDGLIQKSESMFFGYKDPAQVLKAMKKIKAANPAMTSLDTFITRLESNAFGSVKEVADALKAQKALLQPKEVIEFEKLIAKAGKDSYKYYDEILHTIKGSSADLKQVIAKRPKWGFGLVKNKVSLQEILNKGKLINNYKLAGKTLGQKSAGYLMRATECLTNGMFSGKGQILIQAFVIAQSFNEAAKAEKGEKVSTFMASLAELMAFFATMGIQMRAVNHLAGMKFLGMSQAHHTEFQTLMETINNAQKAGDHATYQSAIARLKTIKQAAKANLKWYQKPVKWFGDIMSFGRIKETIKPLKSSKAATAFAHIPYGLKVGLGYAGRAALVFGIVMPFFSNIGKRISYMVFGKPTKTIAKEKAEAKAEEEKAKAEELKQQEELQRQIEEYQKQQQAAQNPQTAQNPQPAQQPVQTAKPGDLMDKMNNPQQPMGAQTMSETTPAASNLSSPDSKIKRHYMPNPILGPENSVNSSSSRTAQIDALMRQADAAEAMAQKYM